RIPGIVRIAIDDRGKSAGGVVVVAGGRAVRVGLTDTAAAAVICVGDERAVFVAEDRKPAVGVVGVCLRMTVLIDHCDAASRLVIGVGERMAIGIVDPRHAAVAVVRQCGGAGGSGGSHQPPGCIVGVVDGPSRRVGRGCHVPGGVIGVADCVARAV